MKSIFGLGFQLNPDDPCVAFRDVNEAQQTAIWHVDDGKLSCVDTDAQDQVIEALRAEYESIFEDGSGKMKVVTGKVHKFLGMTLDYKTPGVCSVTHARISQGVPRLF